VENNHGTGIDKGCPYAEPEEILCKKSLKLLETDKDEGLGEGNILLHTGGEDCA